MCDESLDDLVEDSPKPAEGSGCLKYIGYFFFGTMIYAIGLAAGRSNGDEDARKALASKVHYNAYVCRDFADDAPAEYDHAECDRLTALAIEIRNGP